MSVLNVAASSPSLPTDMSWTEPWTADRVQLVGSGVLPPPPPLFSAEFLHQLLEVKLEQIRLIKQLLHRLSAEFTDSWAVKQ